MGGDPLPAALRDGIFEAALWELADVGIDAFSIEGVARRADVESAVITAAWRDRRVLLMDAMLARAGQSVPVPDTGDLGKDLRQLADHLMQWSSTLLGRQLFHRIFPHGRDADFTEVIPDFWSVQLQAVQAIFRHAAERGELRPDVDHREVTRMLAAALHYDMIFTETAMRPEYAATVRDIILNGVLKPDVRNSVLMEEFENRERMRTLLRATTDAMIDPVALLEAVRDPDGHIEDFVFLEVNPQACVYLQRDRDKLVGAGLIETLPDIASSGLLDGYIRCVETGESAIVEDFEYFSRRFGQMRRFDLRAGRAGEDWLSMTWRDVTDRYRSTALGKVSGDR